ncbi:glycosyltransferase family 52 [Ornithobacterium rhinotracheale]|uniref:glycosyltransferase family 52 n=1 Tax=Ornithobacterium rhinotracheale TaxID=28251 RepID=UPI00129C32FA|nr:glycosyltransferase family 52 [Ornithobacterium rhinotracheale]MRJ10853.1 hypothetical protein [Ornithobacterium rhinotracheale]
MRKRKNKNIVIVYSLYSLLIYFLHIKDIENIKKSFYFFAGISKKVADNFNHYYFNQKKCHDFIYYFYLRLVTIVKWRFVRNGEIYAQDHLHYSPGIIGKKDYILIEDGLSNYKFGNIEGTSEKKQIKLGLLSKIMKYIGNDLVVGYTFGRSKQIKKMLLTQKVKNPKAIEINLQEKWKEATDEKRKFILSIFGLDHKKIAFLKSKKILILTQPLSEDGHIPTEEEKVAIYRSIIKKEGEENVIIKCHPREKTDYSHFFPNAVIFKDAIPAELFNLLDINYQKIYTISSTAALNFKSKNTEIIQIEYSEDIIGYREFKSLIKK